MLVALRSEHAAEAQELRLVDRRQDRHHRRLDNFVLDGGDAERPLSAIRLRYVPPAGRQRSIRSRMDPSMQVPEVRLQVLCIFGPRHLVDARRCGLLQTAEACSQNVDVDVMQKRRQLALHLFLMTASRMRACACDTASRLCVRTVLCRSAFSLAPPLRSTGSAATEAALFARFLATSGRSDFSIALIVGYGLRPSRQRPGHD